MADNTLSSPISRLPPAGPLTGSELTVIVQNEDTVRSTVGAQASLIGAQAYVAAEAITAPALVNVSAAFQVRHANATTGLVANGYIATSIAVGAQGVVQRIGALAGFSGLTGAVYFLDPANPGGVTQTPPNSGSGHYVQQVGSGLSAAVLFVDLGIMNGPI